MHRIVIAPVTHPVAILIYLASVMAGFYIDREPGALVAGFLAFLVLSVWLYTTGYRVNDPDPDMTDNPLAAIAERNAPDKRGAAIMQSVLIAHCMEHGELSVDRDSAVMALVGACKVKGVKTHVNENNRIVVSLLGYDAEDKKEVRDDYPPF